jgi:hydroxyacylglutathione hydrolase
MLTIQSFVFNPFQENTYLLYDDTLECAIIDAGCYSEREKELLRSFITEKQLRPVLLLNTHCHVDHILGNRFVFEQWGLLTHCHKGDEPFLTGAGGQGMLFGLQLTPPPSEVHLLRDGDRVSFGNTELRAILLPGHSAGSLAYYHAGSGNVFVGDVLFLGSIGRTDLPGGDYQTLLSSIRNKLFPLGDAVTVYPGHGPETTIGNERENNPFLT